MKNYLRIYVFFLVNILFLMHSLMNAHSKEPVNINLQECIKIALKNNHLRKISKLSVKMAEAQYNQAMSAYYPEFNIGLSATRMDESFNFIFPEEISQYQIQLPAQLVNPNAPQGTMVPMTTSVTVPEKDVKLMDRDTLISRAEMTWPLFLGGRRKAMVQRASIGIEVAKIYCNRTDVQLIHDISQKYYGAILAKKLEKECKTVVDRFNAVLQLTEATYKQGAGKVKKTDYLRMQLYLSFIESLHADFHYRNLIAHAALANDMGMDSNETLIVADNDIPFEPIDIPFKKILSQTYEFNPDWKLLEAGLKEAEAQITEASSGYFPVIAMTGHLRHIDNDYKKGIVSAKNQDQWQIGLHINIPVFKGFRTQNEIQWAKHRLKKMKEQKHLLKKGLALQLKDAFMRMQCAHKQVTILKASTKTSASYRKLTIASYVEGMAEVNDVIESQLVESVSLGQYYKACFDHMQSVLSINQIIGKLMNL